MKSDMNTSLGRDAIKLTTSKVITVIISVLSAMLLSRFRSLEEYGTYSQILMVINLTTSIVMLGLPNSINYFLACTETNEQREKFLSSYYTISTLLSIIVGIVLVCATPMLIIYFNNDFLKNFIYVLAIYPWAIIIMSSIENVLIVYKRTSIIMIYRIANSIALIIIILIVQIFEWNFQVYMYLFVLVQAVFASSVYIIVKSISGKLKVTFDKLLIKNVLTFSIPIGLASVVGTLNIQLDKLMISKFFDVQQLAVYTNASTEMPVTIVAASLTAVLSPQLARMLKYDKNQEAVTLWGNTTILSYTVICFFAAGFFSFAPDVITLLYSKKYLSGVSVFRIYNIVLLLRCTYFGIILNFKGKTRFILYSSIASLGLNILLNYLMYLVFGFIGPAIATLLSMIVIAVYQLFITSRVINIPFIRILPWKNLSNITLTNIFLGGLFVSIKSIIPIEEFTGSIIESVLLGLAWGCLYFVLMFRMIKRLWKSFKGDER